ncbi:hypothetical protein [Amphibacillus sediminis]|uniref:hypothetical protein n=1 Tax=Amphibacillus sediminis TaxID=360185 RepID=UPI0008359EF4|nr:hypothetical protein [Amphibacillus sediminis]
MNLQNKHWRFFHGIMLVFYLLGLIAFLVIGDLTDTVNQILFGVFVIIVLREVVRYVRRLKRDQDETDNRSSEN